jgi:hypothetical protein
MRVTGAHHEEARVDGAAGSAAVAPPRWPKSGPTKMAKELRGARSGARSQRFGTTVGDSRPTKLLVEPPLATPGHGLELHGMQEVWGSNPHSSTPGQSHSRAFT